MFSTRSTSSNIDVIAAGLRTRRDGVN